MARTIACSGFPRDLANDLEWSILYGALLQRGWKLESVDDRRWPATANAFLAFNCQPSATAAAIRHGISKARRVRLVMEPRVTAPDLYLPSEGDLFGLTISTSPNWTRELGGVYIPWPQRLGVFPKRSEVRRSYLLGLVAGNKQSSISGSQYQLRRRVIREAEKMNLPILVGGYEWGATRRQLVNRFARSAIKAATCGHRPRIFSCSRSLLVRPKACAGIVDDVAQVYDQARFALVIENSPDYVSEKLVDAIRTGSAPIYVGPELREFGFPDGLAIRVEANPKAVLKAALETCDEEVGHLRAAGRRWLASSSARSMSTERVFTDLARILDNYLSESR
jgi:hypothetical protein